MLTREQGRIRLFGEGPGGRVQVDIWIKRFLVFFCRGIEEEFFGRFEGYPNVYRESSYSLISNKPCQI